MKRLKPINGHVLIEPIKYEGFMATEKEEYQEIGKVIDVAPEVESPSRPTPFKEGDFVYFDSWLAVKYPAEERGNYYWLVKYEDIRAYAEQEISE